MFRFVALAAEYLMQRPAGDLMYRQLVVIVTDVRAVFPSQVGGLELETMGSRMYNQLVHVLS